ncbi:MAG: NAD(P)-dependent glycerol-3-phosphate dehydrogenase [Oligoflexia bacterium]|nr:NAD(P)-dependent glycerol-3-phosphate dehydrogenase [Oligoflexia bacterium]
MTQKDFWLNSKVAVIGGGSFGTVLADLVARNCREVRLYVRSEEQARQINATRSNADYLPMLELKPNIAAMSDLERVFDGGVSAVIWALPSSVCRAQARRMAPLFKGDEVLLHATKGIEQGTLKRISEILREELPCPRIGVISGPNLAEEIARGDPAATVVASVFDEVVGAGEALLANDRFRIYRVNDVIGVEWAGTLKNILAIASGALDALQYGWNARAMLITRGLAEIVRFGAAMGAEKETFLSLAGVGDLLATCSSPLSRNYRVGFRLAKGETLEKVLADLGTTAEGVGTVKSVWDFASRRGIAMPITEAVDLLIENKATMAEIVQRLMSRPGQS